MLSPGRLLILFLVFVVDISDEKISGEVGKNVFRRLLGNKYNKIKNKIKRAN